jgi:small subunit ribosomal protein S6
MRNYELTFIVASDVDEQEFNGVLAQVQKWVEDSPGKVTQVDQWGRRRLAYSIKEYNEGYYVTLALEMNPQSTAELERNLKLSEKVIRHLLIRTDMQD